MGMFDGALGRLLGRPTRAGKGARSGPNSTQFVASQQASTPSQASPHSVRKDLLKAAMRETLLRNGIPDHWLTADLLRTNSPARKEQGVHVRFLVRHWDPRLVQHAVALEQDFYQRLVALDPQAGNWLMGFSWQFAMSDLSACPPLPHPGSWTAPVQAETGPLDDKPTTRAGDIIEGPVVIPQTHEDVRADLERLLALRDDDLKRHGDGFAATRPVQL
jgi:hypothetical protein